MISFDVEIDVTDEAAIGRRAKTVATVFAPEPDQIPAQPVVCFALPGGAYSRRYFSFDMPDSHGGGGQAGFHVERGWVFVAIDSLGFGESTNPGGHHLTLDNTAAANAHTVAVIGRQLAKGTLNPAVPPLGDFCSIGIGQSMGGCFTVVQQAQHESYDAVGILGFSSIHTHVPARPGGPQLTWPWLLRSAGLEGRKVLNQRAVDEAAGLMINRSSDIIEAASGAEHPFAWAFHWDDEPADIVESDMRSGVDGAPRAPWRSPTLTPSVGVMMVAPGVVATEAAAIRTPVLLAMGERDVLVDPRMEPLAFRSSRDVTMFVCPRMAHMHNFAHTRWLFWNRIHHWALGVVAQRDVKVRDTSAA